MNELLKQDTNNSSELVMNIVVKAIKAIYPAWRTSIKSQAELDNLKCEWLIAFQENGIKTDIQINRGLSLARKDTSPFLPSCGQFIEWCRLPPQAKTEEQRKLDDEIHWRRLGYNSEAEYSKGEFEKQIKRLKK